MVIIAHVIVTSRVRMGNAMLMKCWLEINKCWCGMRSMSDWLFDQMVRVQWTLPGASGPQQTFDDFRQLATLDFNSKRKRVTVRP